MEGSEGKTGQVDMLAGDRPLKHASDVSCVLSRREYGPFHRDRKQEKE